MSDFYKQNGTDGTSSILVLRDKSAREVAEAMIKSGCQREPFFIFDFDTAYLCVKKFKTKMPRIQIFYAMKSNDYSMMVKLAIALGLGFDCASPGEINKIRQLGVPPTSIIYAMPMKTAEQIKFSRNSGVRHTTFDSTCELNRLKLFWPDARLLVRVKLESDSVYKLGDKFGCEYNEALTLLDEAARLEMNVIGVAFHVGSGCFSKESYSIGLRIARDLFDHESSQGRKMKIIDIGGGFFCDNTDMFDQVADEINHGLEQWFPETDIQVIAEPGRYLCETAFTLYTNINEIRTDPSNKTLRMVYLNSGMNDCLISIEKWHTMEKIKVTKYEENNKLHNTILWGPTPDDRDLFGPLKMTECSPSDWLSFHEIGAYNYVFGTRYCSKGQILTQPVMSLELWNMLKNDPVFSTSNFVTDVFTSGLQTTLPPLLKMDGKHEYACSFNNNSTVID